MPAFISHSSRDEDIYATICRELDAAGVSRWDQGMMTPGRSLANQLCRAIQACEVCVFLLTPARSSRSGAMRNWVHFGDQINQSFPFLLIQM